jgi:hypothetical protein
MKILIIQPNQNFAKSHFSFTINLAYVLADFGHEVVGAFALAFNHLPLLPIPMFF